MSKLLTILVIVLFGLVLIQAQTTLEEKMEEWNHQLNDDGDEAVTESISDFFPQAQNFIHEQVKPTNYVPTGPLAPKDSANQPKMLAISSINWGIISTLFAIVVFAGIVIGILSCISLMCLGPDDSWKPSPPEPFPNEICGRIGYYLKDYFSVPNWRNRLLPLLFGVFFFGFAGYVNIGANIYVQNVMIAEQKGSSPPLRDIGFSIIPYVAWAAGVNICMTILLAIGILNTLIWQKTKNDDRLGFHFPH
jgi:hypothetical protein